MSDNEYLNEQIMRIQEMEVILDRANAAVARLREAQAAFQEMKPELQKLIDYYQSEQWRQDFEDDADGKLPSGLKRGVLSEDAVYDLLTEIADFE